MDIFTRVSKINHQLDHQSVNIEKSVKYKICYMNKPSLQEIKWICFIHEISGSIIIKLSFNEYVIKS